MCLCWQLSVPATGLTHSDHRHPGSIVNRAAVVLPMRTTSTCVLSGVLLSSGEPKSRFSTPAIVRLLCIDMPPQDPDPLTAASADQAVSGGAVGQNLVAMEQVQPTRELAGG